MAGEIARHSERTIANRRGVTKNLLWFLHRESDETCGLQELRSFFAYTNLVRGSEQPSELLRAARAGELLQAYTKLTE